MTNQQFIIRVYGLIINSNQEVLLSDEYVNGIYMTKFPGGGLEFGEGTIDALQREFSEECNGQTITNIRHYYTTDFFQQALFCDLAQLLSIYYMADLKPPICFTIDTEPFAFKSQKNSTQSFRWQKIKSLNLNEITFPIDKFVARKLKEQFP